MAGAPRSHLLVQHQRDTVNQSINGFIVRVGEPDVTHHTSWPESTGECSGRTKEFSQHCGPERDENPP